MAMNRSHGSSLSNHLIASPFLRALSIRRLRIACSVALDFHTGIRVPIGSAENLRRSSRSISGRLQKNGTSRSWEAQLTTSTLPTSSSAIPTRLAVLRTMMQERGLSVGQPSSR